MEVDQTTAGIHYRRHAGIAGDVFTIEKSERAVVAEFAAADAPAAQAALRTLADHPAKLRKPLGYEATEKEVAAASAATPATSHDYGERASLFVGRGMRKEAVADYGKAIELDPGSVWAWSNRAITRIQLGDLAGARTDLDKAAAIDPAYVQVFIGRGMLADLEQRPGEAIAAYTKALQSEPGNGYALQQRAAAYVARGDREHAEADLTAAIAASPDDAAGYVGRGNLMLEGERYDAALKDFDSAHALDPKNAWALANRGMARAWTGDDAAAAKDLDAAAAIDPENAVVFRGRGLLAERRGAPREAIAAYTRALAIEPANGFALGHRAEAERAAGDDAAALRDAAAAIGQSPGWAQMYLLRANIFRGQGKQEAALGEAAAVAAANPKDVYAQVTAANIYVALHKDAEGMRAYDRAIAIKPEAYVYLNRSYARPRADVPARRADLDAALKLEPGFLPAISAKAELQAEGGDAPGAIAIYTAALERAPADPNLLTGRGIAYARSGDGKRADSDFAAARVKADDATSLNNMCWAKATSGVALESALADCDAALKMAPDVAGFLDSRGLALLRLGRLDAATADYDRALAKSPDLAGSRFGRAVAWARKGDKARSAADAAAAVKIDPDVREQFARYGVTL
ncbi:tetratricopeptide repeat protein [Sphingomonas sp.]|uniref:tetratricopeptide repeat protein n=1 Tax=Sphingomonas sp. TaxID=28214 RepID=UPI0035BBB819